MTQEEMRGKLRDAAWYLENFLWIRTKDQKLARLKMKPAQKRLFAIMEEERRKGKPVRIIVLKARQLGFSTVIEGLFFHDTATRKLVETLIIAHSSDATTKLFRMNKLFFDRLPPALRPMRKNSNAREIVFENPEKDAAKKEANPGLRSAIRCVTAGSGGAGRGSTLTNVHASEAAFWPDMKETLDGLLSAVPDDVKTAVVIESTPNGFNAFKDYWDDAVAGRNAFLPLFFPWFEEPGYRRPVPEGREWTEEEQQLRETYGLEDEQLEWRRWCIRNNLGGDAVKFRQEYPSCAEEAFLLSGRPFFDNELLLQRIQAAAEPVRRGRFLYGEGPKGEPKDPVWQEAADGEVLIFAEAERHTPYVIGGDTAGEGSDRFTAFALDNVDGKQVAEIRYGGGSELWYAQQLWCLGQLYNGALVGVEINFSTYPERKLEEWGYPRLYIREKKDDARRTLQAEKLGWRTDPQTRPMLLANLHAVVTQTPELIESRETLQEMLRFVYNDQQRPEAAPGEHDDLVMAAGIAHQIRYQQEMAAAADAEKPRKMLIETMKAKKRRR